MANGESCEVTDAARGEVPERSEHVKPIAGTDSCQVPHVGYVLRGRMTVRADDGSELELVAGDAVLIPPGHDAWTVGDEPCEMVDFGGLQGYAKR
jgi:hypothetical protein